MKRLTDKLVDTCQGVKELAGNALNNLSHAYQTGEFGLKNNFVKSLSLASFLFLSGAIEISAEEQVQNQKQTKEYRIDSNTKSSQDMSFDEWKQGIMENVVNPYVNTYVEKAKEKGLEKTEDMINNHGKEKTKEIYKQLWLPIIESIGSDKSNKDIAEKTIERAYVKIDRRVNWKSKEIFEEIKSRVNEVRSDLYENRKNNRVMPYKSQIENWNQASSDIGEEGILDWINSSNVLSFGSFITGSNPEERVSKNNEVAKKAYDAINSKSYSSTYNQINQ